MSDTDLGEPDERWAGFAVRARSAGFRSVHALAGRLDVDPQAAFDALRGYARSRNLRLSDVARAVVEGSIEVAG